ncbi:unnamed protein product [Staurois parvus]|uniref:Alpha/beta hydrolase n=1 Tax=Staurois parvus TaxID=386267 RepID=A0ABN9ER20_9NEOB|nr:unnamed protein product [Staurois parvus]
MGAQNHVYIRDFAVPGRGRCATIHGHGWQSPGPSWLFPAVIDRIGVMS